ncbi:glutamine amidotransferase [Sphingobium sp. CFD-1]|uniref:glutamine amidotransferase n=1 Tax=Sphingobium sp. CFD-1 TaxID=2878545 RepID=UPI00214B1CF1|nr:glutamine amidotransferase [Sphingobium sp. CFD-1]
MLKTAVAIRHLAFEDLGVFEPVLLKAGFKVHYYDIGVDELWTLEPVKTELLIVLGGPIGAYEDDKYPFLLDELKLLRERLAANRPTLGICLGAQLIARALGARVYPGPAKEIGFKPVTLSPAGERSPLVALGGAPVLHWHGDTFDLPAGAEHLASTDICLNQAFSYGNALGLQFHPEAGGPGFERWLIGHALELSEANVDLSVLRADSERYAKPLAAAAGPMLESWLRTLRRSDTFDSYARTPPQASGS